MTVVFCLKINWPHIIHHDVLVYCPRSLLRFSGNHKNYIKMLVVHPDIHHAPKSPRLMVKKWPARVSASYKQDNRESSNTTLRTTSPWVSFPQHHSHQTRVISKPNYSFPSPSITCNWRTAGWRMAVLWLTVSMWSFSVFCKGWRTFRDWSFHLFSLPERNVQTGLHAWPVLSFIGIETVLKNFVCRVQLNLWWTAWKTHQLYLKCT